MARYQVEREGSLYTIRDTLTGRLVINRTLKALPERFRSVQRAERRRRELEERLLRDPSSEERPWWEGPDWR